MTTEVTNDDGEITTAVAPIQPNAVQQARTDSVSKMLDAAYMRASTLQLTPEESKALLADFPDDDVKGGAKGKDGLLYIEHMSIRRRLLQVFGPGAWTMITRRLWTEVYATQKGEAVRVYAEVAMLIRGCFVGESIGAGSFFPNNPQQDYSDAAEAAESEALRRIAGKKLGVGLQVWNKAFCDGWKRRQGGRREEPQQEQAVPQQPTDGPISEKWVESIRKWIAHQGLSAALFCAHYGIKDVAELPRSKVRDAGEKLKAGFPEWKMGREKLDTEPHDEQPSETDEIAF